MTRHLSKAVLLIILLMIISAPLSAQAQRSQLRIQSLTGPRLGVTVVPPGTGLAEDYEEYGLGPAISQFGWHIGTLVQPEGAGPAMTFQMTGLVGGVEYGYLIPSGTVSLGVRLPSGYEFGVGPSASLGGSDILNPALVIAVGKTNNYGGLNVPMNFATSINKAGIRFSLIVGYALLN